MRMSTLRTMAVLLVPLAAGGLLRFCAIMIVYGEL
jgi:hypothetical protein